MKTVVLITFNIESSLTLIKMASKNEPDELQLINMLKDNKDRFKLNGEIKQKPFLQEQDNKIYLFTVGKENVFISVERLEVMEFEY
jgi:hypothetical protein